MVRDNLDGELVSRHGDDCRGDCRAQGFFELIVASIREGFWCRARAASRGRASFNRHHRPVSTIMELGKLAICSLAANVVSIGVSMALAVLHHKWRVDDDVPAQLQNHAIDTHVLQLLMPKGCLTEPLLRCRFRLEIHWPVP